MSGKTVCKSYEEDAKRYRLEKEGVGRVFSAYLLGLIIGFFGIFVVLIAAANAQGVAQAVVAAFYATGILDILSAVIVVPILYKGFRRLGEANPEYSIGAPGALLQGIGGVLSGLVVMKLASDLSSKIGSIGIEEVRAALIRIAVYSALVGIIGIVGGIMVVIALWRLGDNYPEHGGDVVKIGIMIWIIGYVMQILHVRGAGLLAFIGLLVLLYGLHRVEQGLESLAEDSEYEFEKCLREASGAGGEGLG